MKAKPLEWFRVLHGDQAWSFVFTGPRFCRHWDGSWAGLTSWEDFTVYLDPRTQKHKGGLLDTVVHESLHIVRGPDVDLRTDEALVESLATGLVQVLGPYRPALPPLPEGIERLQRMCNRWRREAE